MELFLANILIVLAIAMLIAILARRLQLPYTVGLVLVGIAFAFVPVRGETALTHDFIFEVILPPLLFEAAIAIHWEDLRRDMLPVLVLSTFGTAVAAMVVAIGLVFLLHWPITSATMLGVLIAATDPVAIIAMFKDNNVTGRVRLLVESESLFNDGVAAVLFVVALSWTQAGDLSSHTATEALVALAEISLGGIAVGLVCGALAIAVAGRTDDHLVETALTAVAAYGSFLVAEHFHVSGVLATVAAGLLMGNLGILREEERNTLSPKGREFVLAFWEFAAFIANSIIFPLIGLNIAAAHFGQLGVMPLIAVIILVVLSRAVSVYPLSFLFARSSLAILPKEQHILWWAGLRGALALALALALPYDLPLRGEVVVAAFGVVAFSVIIQGLTMPLLLRRLGFVPARAAGSLN
jgi:monovalent cation:H+ antiporter, CPA1 family